MIWRTAWWGIQFIPENDQDREALRRLMEVCPGNAQIAYEHGEFSWEKSEFVNEEGETVADNGLCFHR